jgi:nitroreductase
MISDDTALCSETTGGADADDSLLACADAVLTTTRSVRLRLDLARPVELPLVEQCLQVALQAPNGGNAQLWRWLVVADPEQRAAIASHYRQSFRDRYGLFLDAPDEELPPVLRAARHLADNLHRVPVLVIPCLQVPDGVLPQGNQAGLWGSLLPAAWSYMLAARSRGLGTAWTAVHLAREREVAEVLGLPATVRQGALIPTAHLTPGTRPRPGARRPLGDVLHLDRWTNEADTC